MPNTQQNPPPNHSPRAGYYPDHERVIKLDHLADNITELVAHLDAGTFQLLELICEFDENEGWAGPGIRSCAHWLNWKCGMSMGPARERVRVARALPELPAISAAFRKGEVSYSKVRAMTRVVEGFLAGVGGDRPVNDLSGGDRYMVNIHTEVETLKEDGTGAESEIEDRGHVPAETSRRLSCDCSTVHWHENAQGDPLNIGRKTRSIPPAIRRALKRRDQGCRFPGCTCSRFVDAHHIQHWADGGETSMDNLVLLCRTHHRLVHEAGYGVENTAGRGVVFRMPDGKVIPQGPEKRSRGKEVRSGTDREAGLGHVFAIMSGNHKNGLNITPETSIPQWHGEQMDHGTAVDMLLGCE